ncbi:MAG: hypothetical protein K1X75_01885 [Leptospirales bacterium]|nr:hypothetical protein [Leptospirales bacterium]
MLFAATITLLLPSCQKLSDSIRSLGEKNRQPVEKPDQAEMERLERDFRLSRERALDLQDKIHQLANEERLQGRLAWQLARAHMQRARYDMAAAYMMQAAGGVHEGDVQDPGVSFEKALPYFREALRKHSIDPDLLLEAGLAFANASRAMGWEPNRFDTAVFLLERMAALRPEDSRPRYQLALLFGKTGDASRRDVARAIELLRGITAVEEAHIPAHFALGHLYVESGDLASARLEYQAVLEQLESLRRRGAISGDLDAVPNYRQAKQNLEALDQCLNNADACSTGSFDAAP